MAPVDRILCPACGRENQKQETCSFCGTHLGDAVPPSESRNEHPPPPTDPAESVPATQETGPFQTVPTMGQPTPQAPFLAPKFAGFWIRVLAYIVDSFVVQLMIWAVLAVGILGYTSGSQNELMGEQTYRLLQMNLGSVFWLNLAVTLSYFTFFLGSRGQTPGKMLFGLKVIRADGNNPSYSQALMRTLGYYLNHFLTLELGFLWVAVDPRKQGLHDKIAGTYEIRPGMVQVQGYEPPYPQVPAR